MKTNILITSISGKVPLISAVRRAGEKYGNNIILFGSDSNSNNIGRHFVDNYWATPPDEELSTEEIFDYCRTNEINSIVPTRDEELLFWAEHKDRLSDARISVMVSDPGAVKTCVDKLEFFRKSKEFGYPVCETSASICSIESDRFVVKERFGGVRPRKIGFNLTREQSGEYATQLREPIYQPLIEGGEISVDLYISKRSDVKGVVARRRELVIPQIGGESQKTTTFRDRELEEMCAQFAKDLKLYGHAVLQILVDKDKGYHIVECNARFGGASTASVAAGLDSFFWFLLEANGADLNRYPFKRIDEEITQIRFSKDIILPSRT